MFEHTRRELKRRKKLKEWKLRSEKVSNAKGCWNLLLFIVAAVFFPPLFVLMVAWAIIYWAFIEYIEP